MSRAPWVTHFGFTRTPFSKTIPAAQLCDRASHQEAVARIRFCTGESLLGVITGQVGVGKTVFIVDEAQSLAPGHLEELRLLTNAEMDSQSPFALLLVGQPTLARELRLACSRHSINASPRATSSRLLTWLKWRNTSAIIWLWSVGPIPSLADDAIARLHKVSLGLPRALNNAASAATAGKATG